MSCERRPPGYPVLPLVVILVGFALRSSLSPLLDSLWPTSPPPLAPSAPATTQVAFLDKALHDNPLDLRIPGLSLPPGACNIRISEVSHYGAQNLDDLPFYSRNSVAQALVASFVCHDGRAGVEQHIAGCLTPQGYSCELPTQDSASDRARTVYVNEQAGFAVVLFDVYSAVAHNFDQSQNSKNSYTLTILRLTPRH